ncbi:hypothetical protein FGO68_gene7049 [Halteria grandinella]|uniref:Uncharacterized protein n=1 Tax=Halteria grandinella TaxID=5974 RepID=A0A8J8T9R7_HALGN|nr:hypothetical protein FGO68_gene7049 [Halteria grandinella]
MDRAGVTLLIIGTILSFFLSMLIQFIFSLLNDLSALMLLILIPIYSSGLAQPIQAIILNLIQLDLLLTDKWLANMIFTEKQQVEQDGPLNVWFGINGYKSKQGLLNIGSTSIYLLILLLGFTIICVLRCQTLTNGLQEFSVFQIHTEQRKSKKHQRSISYGTLSSGSSSSSTQHSLQHLKSISMMYVTIQLRFFNLVQGVESRIFHQCTHFNFYCAFLIWDSVCIPQDTSKSIRYQGIQRNLRDIY